MTTALPAPISTETGLKLTDTERAQIAYLTAQLSGVPPRLVDERAWMDAARRLAHQLPLRLREELRDYRHDSGTDGLLILRNLPVDDALLPETPTAPESVERHATQPAAVTALISQYLGEVIAYREEKSGALVQNVVPVPGREATQSNAGSALLELHVENAFHPNRPDFVGLFCLRNDHSGTAGTLVSSIRRALPLISDPVIDVLMAPRFATQPPPSFHAGESVPRHPVLDGDRNDPNIRVDFSATSPMDEEAAEAMMVLRGALLDAAAVLVLQPGELAFIDNRLSVHGRTSFVPRYDGRDRWLHRTFVHLDNRRSRSHRADNGFVLS